MFLSSIVTLWLIPSSLAATINYNWNIGFINTAPDGFVRRVIAINGEWPLPVIEGTVGDTIIINVTNGLVTESTGLHFHGISQNGSPMMDGPGGVTQCPIPPGASFVYEFKVSPRFPTDLEIY